MTAKKKNTHHSSSLEVENSKRLNHLLQTSSQPRDIQRLIHKVKSILEHESEEDIAFVLSQCSYNTKEAIDMLLEGKTQQWTEVKRKRDKVKKPTETKPQPKSVTRRTARNDDSRRRNNGRIGQQNGYGSHGKNTHIGKGAQGANGLPRDKPTGHRPSHTRPPTQKPAPVKKAIPVAVSVPGPSTRMGQRTAAEVVAGTMPAAIPTPTLSAPADSLPSETSQFQEKSAASAQPQGLPQNRAQNSAGGRYKGRATWKPKETATAVAATSPSAKLPTEQPSEPVKASPTSVAKPTSQVSAPVTLPSGLMLQEDMTSVEYVSVKFGNFGMFNGQPEASSAAEKAESNTTGVQLPVSTQTMQSQQQPTQQAQSQQASSQASQSLSQGMKQPYANNASATNSNTKNNDNNQSSVKAPHQQKASQNDLFPTDPVHQVPHPNSTDPVVGGFSYVPNFIPSTVPISYSFSDAQARPPFYDHQYAAAAAAPHGYARSVSPESKGFNNSVRSPTSSLTPLDNFSVAATPIPAQMAQPHNHVVQQPRSQTNGHHQSQDSRQQPQQQQHPHKNHQHSQMSNRRQQQNRNSRQTQDHNRTVQSNQRPPQQPQAYAQVVSPSSAGQFSSPAVYAYPYMPANQFPFEATSTTPHSPQFAQGYARVPGFYKSPNTPGFAPPSYGSGSFPGNVIGNPQGGAYDDMGGQDFKGATVYGVPGSYIVQDAGSPMMRNGSVSASGPASTASTNKPNSTSSSTPSNPNSTSTSNSDTSKNEGQYKQYGKLYSSGAGAGGGTGGGSYYGLHGLQSQAQQYPGSSQPHTHTHTAHTPASFPAFAVHQPAQPPAAVLQPTAAAFQQRPAFGTEPVQH